MHECADNVDARALILNVSEQTVRYRLEKLQREGRITHKGSTKAGEWVILKLV